MLKQGFIASEAEKIGFMFLKLQNNSMEGDYRSLLCLHTAACEGFAAVFSEHLYKTHLEFLVKDLAAANSSAVW